MSQYHKISEPEDDGPAPESAGAALADRIAADIRASRAAPGTVVASAQDLRASHEAGRPVVRQAVRILEERGIAFMRRGAGGGLVVAAPSPTFAGRALSIQIEHDMDDMMQVGPLPMAIDTHLFLHGAPRLDWDACESLRRMARRLDRLSDEEFLASAGHRQLFNAIRTASAEPTVILAQQTSTECTIDLIPYSVNVAGEGRRGASWTLTLETVDALVANDPARLFDCRSRQVAIFQASWGDWPAIDRDPKLTPQIDDPARPEFQIAGNRADRLAREILREIRLLGWQAGARIGSGAELAARYAAGPDTVRQAVLMLQEHRAVQVEKGRHGGLYVAAPDRDQAVESARAYLQRTAADPGDMQSFLLQLVLQAFDGFPARDPERLRRSAAAMLATQRTTAPAPPLWELAAQLCANPVLSLFTAAIAPLLPSRPADPALVCELLEAALAADLAKGRRLLQAAGSAA